MNITASVVREHHAAAAVLTSLDVDALDVQRQILAAAMVAASDADLDRLAVLLGVLLSALPAAHPLVVAARSGIEVGDQRRAHRRDEAETSRQVCAGWLAERAARRTRRWDRITPAITYPPARATPEVHAQPVGGAA